MTAAAFYGVGQLFEGVQGGGNFFGSKLSGADFVAKVAAHGVVGGVMSVLQGGKFGHGFVAAGASQGFAGKINGLNTGAGRIIASAVLGGTVSRVTGGRFANGAATAAFGRLFNEAAHALKEERFKPSDKQIKQFNKLLEQLRSDVIATEGLDPDLIKYLKMSWASYGNAPQSDWVGYNNGGDIRLTEYVWSVNGVLDLELVLDAFFHEALHSIPRFTDIHTLTGRQVTPLEVQKEFYRLHGEQLKVFKDVWDGYW